MNTNARHRGGCTRSSGEAAVMAVERRGAQEQPTGEINLQKDESRPKAKPFVISKQMVMQAYRKVKSNGGVAGVDGETLKEFEAWATAWNAPPPIPGIPWNNWPPSSIR